MRRWVVAMVTATMTLMTTKLGTAEEGTRLEDLESGRRDFGIDELPDIPEASGSNSANWAEEVNRKTGESGRQTHANSGHIDPRTGIVSPQAVARDTAEGGD
ncbi:hypothetical protein B0O99DRAFT_599532 [Bisporella sp. PMI_857]|nr:hypothetical protein B0O99DRAFT_599532 [Bisporella sp. PMI_857]